MKKYFLLFASAALSVLCISCDKDIDNKDIDNKDVVVGNHAMSVTIDCTNPEVKTVISQEGLSYKPAWLSTDKLGVYTMLSSTENNTNSQFSITSLLSGVASSFNGTIEYTGAGVYDFYGYYPYTAGQLVNSLTSVQMTLPTAQNPTSTSFDGAADVLVAQKVSKTVSEGQSSVDGINFSFARILSILKINISNVDAPIDNEIIKSVRLTAEGHVLSGTYSLDLTDGSTSSWSGSDYVQADYSNDSYHTGGFTSWLTVNPQVLSSGETITLKVISSDHILQKSVVLSKAVTLKSGKIIELNFDMSGCQVNNSPTTPSGMDLLEINLSADPDGFNMLSDGGFENHAGLASSAYKAKSLWYIPSYAWTYDDSDVRSGSRSLFVDMNTHDFRDACIQTINLKKSTTYVFTVDMKTAWNNANVFMGFRASSTHDQNTNRDGSTSWLGYSYSWANDSDTQANVFVGGFPWDNFWVKLDNLKVCPESYAGNSFLPSSVSIGSGLTNASFNTLSACSRMVVWPIGNKASTTSYGVALYKPTIDGTTYGTAFATATATATGLRIDSFVGNGKEMLTGAEGTYCVPTTGFSSLDGSVQYVAYYATDTDPLSTDTWTSVGTYIAKSIDGGKTWTKVSALSKDASSKFVNCSFLVQNSTDVLIYGSPAGRGGTATYSAKVSLANFEDASAWRYWDGSDYNSNSESDAVSIFYGPTSELTVFDDSDTGNYIALYRSGTTGALVYRESINPGGCWSGEKVVTADPAGAYYYAPSVVWYPTNTDLTSKLFVIANKINN